MPDRLSCCVPFCQRTRKDDGQFREWICGQHWKAVPARIRRFKLATHRRAIRTLEPRDMERAGRVWARAKRAAIEAAGRIG